MKKRRKRAPKTYKNHEDLQKEFLETTLVKKCLWNENWLDGYQYYMLLKNQHQLRQEEYPLLSEHPTWIYEQPRNGHIYFLCDVDLEKDGNFKLGFPRTPQLNKKSWKWKRNNFPTKLPKNDPKIVYICGKKYSSEKRHFFDVVYLIYEATTEGISYSDDGTRNLKRYRMHIAKLIELYDKEQRGETESEGTVLCQMLEIEYGRTKEGKKYIPKPIGLVKSKNLIDKEKTQSNNGKLKRKQKAIKIEELEEESEREECQEDEQQESVYLPSSQNASDDKQDVQDEQCQENSGMQIKLENDDKLQQQCEMEQEKIEDVTDIFVADISRDQKSASSEEKIMIKKIEERQNLSQKQQQDMSSESIKSQIQMLISSPSMEGDNSNRNTDGLDRNLGGSEEVSGSRILDVKQEFNNELERRQYESEGQRSIFDVRINESAKRLYGLQEMEQNGRVVFRESEEYLYEIRKQGNGVNYEQLIGQSQAINGDPEESLPKSKRITKKKKKVYKARKSRLIKQTQPKTEKQKSMSWQKTKKEQSYLSPVINTGYNLLLITPPLVPLRKQLDFPTIQQENEFNQDLLENSQQSSVAMKISYQTPKSHTQQSGYDNSYLDRRFHRNYDNNNLKSPGFSHNINIFEDHRLSLFNQAFSPMIGQQQGFSYCSSDLRYVSSIKKPMNDQRWNDSSNKDYQRSSGMNYRKKKSFVNADLLSLIRDSSDVRRNESRSYDKFCNALKDQSLCSPGLNQELEESGNKRNLVALNDEEMRPPSKNLFQSEREELVSEQEAKGREGQEKEINRRSDQYVTKSLENNAVYCLKPVSFFKWNKRNNELYAFIR